MTGRFALAVEDVSELGPVVHTDGCRPFRSDLFALCLEGCSEFLRAWSAGVATVFVATHYGAAGCTWRLFARAVEDVSEAGRLVREDALLAIHIRCEAAWHHISFQTLRCAAQRARNEPMVYASPAARCSEQLEGYNT